MWTFSPSDNRLPTKGMKDGKLPSGSDRKSTHLHVAKTPGPVNDQEFFDEVSGGEKRKQSVNPQHYSMFLNRRGEKKCKRHPEPGKNDNWIITAGRPSCVSLTTFHFRQQTHLHHPIRERLYNGLGERQELRILSEYWIAHVKSCWWAQEYSCLMLSSQRYLRL